MIIFSIAEQLEMANEEIVEVFECNICGEDFKTVKGFDQNYKLVHDEKAPKETELNKCEFCESTFKHARNVAQHIAVMHKKVTNAKCEKCNKIFFNARTLKTHTINAHIQNQKRLDVKFVL